MLEKREETTVDKGELKSKMGEQEGHKSEEGDRRGKLNKKGGREGEGEDIRSRERSVSTVSERMKSRRASCCYSRVQEEEWEQV